jgi:sialic acid synthase SpsE
MELDIGGRRIGARQTPLVIAEIGINHEGSLAKAIQMVDAAADVGCECVKFQSHVVDDEMIPNAVVPGNATETIWNIMSRCALGEADERRLKSYVEEKGMIFLCTPFSRAAATRLAALQVVAYKIGSGECNNYPLIRYVASFGRPIILSTGMNDLESIRPAVDILRRHRVPYALLHCTSIYPTPHHLVRLGAIRQLASVFEDAVVGFSDHSIGNYACFGAVAHGASIVEKHFTADKTWPGPDVPISADPDELRDLIEGCRAVHAAGGGRKEILAEEQPTIDFAYACVVTLRNLDAGEPLTPDNVWVKRPGTGEIRAGHFDEILGRVAARAVPVNTQLSWNDIA